MSETRGGDATIVPHSDRWMRLLYMVVFAIIGYVVYWLILFFAVVQFGLTLLTGNPNENLKDFSGKLNTYLKTVADFVGYATDTVPFPFSPLDKETAAKPARKRASKSTAKSSAKPKSKPATEPKPAADDSDS